MQTVDKNTLRRKLRRARRAIPTVARRLLSDHITSSVLALPIVEAARCVALYAETDRTAEVSTVGLHRALRQRGVVVAYPRVTGDRLTFYRVDDRAALVSGYRDLLEPPHSAHQVPGAALEVIVAPGLGFTRAGARLGQGGGFYDRLLAEWPDTPSIGLAFEVQLLEALPTAEHDQAVDFVITEGSDAPD